MSTMVVIRGIVSYPSLFRPSQVNGQGAEQFRARVIMDADTDWNAINAAVEEAKAKRWGQKIPADLAMPFHDASEDGFPGQWYVNAKANPDYPPDVVDQAMNKILDGSKIFSGCICNFALNFFGYDAMGNRGVSVGLSAVQLVDNVNVKRLDNRVDARKVFQPIAGAPEQIAPTPFSQPETPAQTPVPGPAATSAPEQGIYPHEQGIYPWKLSLLNK